MQKLLLILMRLEVFFYFCLWKRVAVFIYFTQARNFMRQMKVGQRAFFYHSNCKEPGVAGLMKVSHPSHQKQTHLPP